MTSPGRQEELNRLWADPQNWTPSGLYRCESDPRTWVLKRGNGVGYTINIAHRRAPAALFGVLAIALAPFIASLVMGPSAPSWLFLAELLVPIIVVVVTLVWVSRGQRD